MPILGGLLKKRRTKDSRGSKDLNSPTENNSTATGGRGATRIVPQPHGQQRSASQQAYTNTSNEIDGKPLYRPHTAAVTGSDNAAASAAAPDASSAPTMNAQRIQPQHPAASALQGNMPQHKSPQQHHQNVASIKNIINPPQQEDGSSQKTGEGGFVAEQPIRTAVQRHLKGKYSLGDFTLRRTLGTGSFGRVHLVQSIHNHRFYAIKVLKKQQVVKMKQVEHTNDERRMLERVKHPFLVTLWGTFQDPKNLYMVMDFVEGGELFSLLRKSQVRIRAASALSLLSSQANGHQAIS